MDIGAAWQAGQMIGQVAGNYFTNKANKLQANTANYIRGLNNKTKEVENERDATITGIQRWRQSVANERVYENAAKDQEVIETNFWRQRDARQRASFSDQIRYAEEEGRMAASAAVSGVTGSVVTMLNDTSRLRKAMEDAGKAQTEQQFSYDKNRQQFSTYWANLDALDYSMVFDNPQVMDATRTIPKRVSLLSGVDPKGMKAIAQGVDFSFK